MTNGGDRQGFSVPFKQKFLATINDIVGNSDNNKYIKYMDFLFSNL